MENQISIYVLPTVHGLPPQAVIGESIETEEGSALIGEIVTWSADMGAWISGGLPIPTEVGEAVTEHAKSLGVEW